MKAIIVLLLSNAVFFCNGTSVLWGCFSSSSVLDGQFRFEWSSIGSSNSIWIDVTGRYSSSASGIILRSETSTIEFIGNWLQASYGELVDASTTMNVGNYFYYGRFDKYGAKESGYSIYDLSIVRGEDTYLAFCGEILNGDSHDFVESGIYLYGWLKFTIDCEGKPVLIDSAIDLDGGPMIVGGGSAIPEPSAGLLLLLGCSLLALRRRKSARVCLTPI